jgi:hypothetical protein
MKSRGINKHDSALARKHVISEKQNKFENSTSGTKNSFSFQRCFASLSSNSPFA